MSDLISREALKKEIHRYALDAYCVNLENSKKFAGYSNVENYCEGLYEATELIDNLPAVDAVEVVHGRWIKPTVIDGRAFSIPHCSICYGVPCGVDEHTHFCPNCGAKMNEVSE